MQVSTWEVWTMDETESDATVTSTRLGLDVMKSEKFLTHVFFHVFFPCHVF